MGIYLILLVLIFVLYFKFKLKIKIKWRTFLKKGFRPNRDGFGVYCYCGKQGKGKTYSVIEYLLQEQKKRKSRKIFCNIPNIVGLDYEYFRTFEELLCIQDDDCIIVYDEIFTAIEKSRGLGKRVMSFLSQMRKRNNIFLTTAQEWVEINITLRRYVRYQIDCNMIPIPFTSIGLLIKTFRDGDRMKWDNDEQEHIAPIISTTVTKTVLEVANAYDTYEVIEVN